MELDCCFVQAGPEIVLPKDEEEQYLDRERALQRTRESHNQAIEKLQLAEQESDPKILDREQPNRDRHAENLNKLQAHVSKLHRILAIQEMIATEMKTSLQGFDSLSDENRTDVMWCMRERVCGEVLFRLRSTAGQQVSELAAEVARLLARIRKSLEDYREIRMGEEHQANALIKSRLLQMHNIKKQINLLDDEEDDFVRRGNLNNPNNQNNPYSLLAPS